MASLIEGRRLTFIAGTSRKYWEWRVYEDGSNNPLAPRLSYRFVFRWGRIGTGGQTMTEYFTDKNLALWKARARESMKLRAGYQIDTEGDETRESLAEEKASRWLASRPPAIAQEAKRNPKKDEPPSVVATRRVKLLD